jgi:hypothetical protein
MSTRPSQTRTRLDFDSLAGKYFKQFDTAEERFSVGLKTRSCCVIVFINEKTYQAMFTPLKENVMFEGPSRAMTGLRPMQQKSAIMEHGDAPRTAGKPSKTILGTAGPRRALGDITNKKAAVLSTPVGKTAVLPSMFSSMDDIESMPAFCAPVVESEVDLRTDELLARLHQVTLPTARLPDTFSDEFDCGSLPDPFDGDFEISVGNFGSDL